MKVVKEFLSEFQPIAGLRETVGHLKGSMLFSLSPRALWFHVLWWTPCVLRSLLQDQGIFPHLPGVLLLDLLDCPLPRRRLALSYISSSGTAPTGDWLIRVQSSAPLLQLTMTLRDHPSHELSALLLLYQCPVLHPPQTPRVLLQSTPSTDSLLPRPLLSLRPTVFLNGFS